MVLKKSIPKMTVGKYVGTPVDQLPNSYLRWLITQDFSKEILEVALAKLKESPYCDEYVSVSRHAYDQFSLRFIHRWEERVDKTVGLGTFIVKEALLAWDSGIDVSRYRHRNDGILKELEEIVWVFNANPQYPDYKDVITCYPKI